jgi:hypothetical protein
LLDEQKDYPWLGLTGFSQADRFAQGSTVESVRWMVLHRPVELAGITGKVRTDTYFTDYPTNQNLTLS